MADVRTTDAESVSGIHLGMTLKLEVEPGVVVQDVLEVVHHRHGPDENVLLGFEKVRPNRLEALNYVGATCFSVARNVEIEVVASGPDQAQLAKLAAKLTAAT